MPFIIPIVAAAATAASAIHTAVDFFKPKEPEMDDGDIMDDEYDSGGDD